MSHLQKAIRELEALLADNPGLKVCAIDDNNYLLAFYYRKPETEERLFFGPAEATLEYSVEISEEDEYDLLKVHLPKYFSEIYWVSL